MARTAKTNLRARQPDLCDTRNGRHLLVWGEIAQWLLVDDELLSFITELNGQRPFKKVLQRHAKKFNKPLAVVEQEAAPIIAELQRKGITGPRAPEAPEVARIANVTVNLTNACNLRCSFCYTLGRRSPEMPIEALIDRLREARPLLDDNASLIILGGEPTLKPERLLKLIDASDGLFSVAPMVSTNGTLLTDELVRELAARQVEVQVSIDDALAERHDRLRGAGVFDQAVSGIRRLRAAGIYTILSMVFRRDNIEAFEPYLDLARELEVPEARFIPMRQVGAGLDHSPDAPDQRQAFRHLLDVLARRPELRPLLRRDYFSIQMTVCRFGGARTSCGIGRRVIFIDADGKVFPCPNHVGEAFAAGDLSEQSLAEIYAGGVMSTMRERYRVSAYEDCAPCVFRGWCAGDCRGEVIALGRKPTARSPHCEELKEVFLEMLWLIANDDQRLGTQEDTPSGQRTAESFVD